MNMKQLLRQTYQSLIPESCRHYVRRAAEPRISIIRAHTYLRSSGKVLSGPFKGMKLPLKRVHLAKVFGTYEMELHEAFRQLDPSHIKTFIDIGAAEGYYAVGVALWAKNCNVIAYEVDSRLHRKIKSLAKLNDVSSRIEIRGLCDLTQLKAIRSQLAGALVLVDIEGYEKVLLDPNLVQELSQATLLVETHDHLVPGCKDAMISRFSASHNISDFPSRDRSLDEYPLRSILKNMSVMRSSLPASISDGREAPNGWLLMTPKQR